MSSSESEVIFLYSKNVVCSLEVGGHFLLQVEAEFKYPGVPFMSDGRMEQETDRQIGVAAAIVKKKFGKDLKLSINHLSRLLPSPMS